MDSFEFLKYTLSRIGLMLFVILFSVVFGRVIFPALASFVPDSLDGLNQFFLSQNVGSFIAWLISILFLTALFYNDGKKQAAYEIWSSVNIVITTLLMLLVYFVPCIFRDSFAQDGQGKFFFDNAYFPAYWLNNSLGLEYTLSVAVTIGSILVLLLGVYSLAYKRYIKKHPTLLSHLRDIVNEE